MEPLILALVAGVAGLGGFAYARMVSARREAAWRRAAEAARLTHVRVEKIAGFVSGLSGEAGPLSVRLVERYQSRQRTGGTVILIWGFQHEPGELSFRQEGMGSALSKALGTRELEMGDPWFDQNVYLQGSAELACAVFDDDTRLRVVHMLEGEHRQRRVWRPRRLASLAGGRRSAHRAAAGGLGNAEQCQKVLSSAIVTAARLVRPPDLAERLAANLGREPVEDVRLANLTALIERHLEHPAARAALEKAARRDGNEEIRLRAGLALGGAGRDTLLEIASSETSDDGRAARAIASLGDGLDAELAKRLLDDALLTRRLASAEACLARLGQAGGADVVRRLARILVVEEGAVAAAAVRAVGATGEPGAEALLIEQLNRQSGEALVAVAGELQRMGTAAAVMPLRAAEERSGGGDFRRAAWQAIAAIQLRLQGAARGQLSIAAGETGQVTLADDGRGGLALADDDGDQT